jgi:hypothetical protein
MPVDNCTMIASLRLGNVCRLSEKVPTTNNPGSQGLCIFQSKVARHSTPKLLRRRRARYAAELSRRRFIAVGPDNRLVAKTLEADWNEQLRQLDALQLEQDQQRDADQQLLSEEAQNRVLQQERPVQP